MTAPDKPIEKTTLAAFEAFIALPENRDRRFELVDGEIVETMPTLYHNLISRNLFLALYLFVQRLSLGEVVYETSYRASDADEQNYRIPDLSFTLKERLLPVPERGPVAQIPDLCIEIQSPDDDPGDMRVKAAYYLTHGAREVWLIFTRRPRVEVMYPDGDSDFFNVDDTLTSLLLPEFRMSVAEIFKIDAR